ncbi:MAG: hypothetical protein ACI4E1_14260 [Lachnospira sp.]
MQDEFDVKPDNLIEESQAEININEFTVDEDNVNWAEYEKDSFTRYDEAEQKKMLFKEHVRLKEFSKNLEDERKLIEIQKNMLQRQQSKNMLLKKQLEGQQNLFEQKWQILEKETRQLAIDKEKFEREKLMYKDKVYREARRTMSNAENVKIFFKGVNDTESLKKRYKALLKIYHPDNVNGDDSLALAIKTEYERLSRFYLGT